MILDMDLFGLNLEPLYESIAAAESASGNHSANVYRLKPEQIAACNRFLSVFKLSDLNCPFKCRFALELYWKVYARRYMQITGKRPTYETLVRIHYGGPDGFADPSTDRQWLNVRSQLTKRINFLSNVSS